MSRLSFAAIAAFACLTAHVWADAKLTSVAKPPAGLSDKIVAAVSPTGQQVVSDDGAICTLWVAKEVAAKADFKPSLNVKYPFETGQFLGVLKVDKASEFTDFRGQEVAAGVYTLRYGKQPVDGNHIGTSELYDFLLAIPADSDADPAAVTSFEKLSMMSAKTTGSNHPAIFSLLPTEQGDGAAKLIHDESKDYWIVSLAVATSSGKVVPLRLVVVGVSEG